MVVDRNNLKDPNYKAEDFNMPTFVDDGPVKYRKCTDTFFYLIFVLFLLAMFACSVYGYQKGQPEKLFAPLDSDGHICGYDQGYEKYPYLYIWDIAYAVKDVNNVFDSGVCVTECPSASKQGTFAINCMVTDYLTKQSKECADAPLPYDSKAYISFYCIPDSEDIPQEVKDNSGVILKAIGADSLGLFIADIGVSRKAIALCAFISLGIAYAYMYFLKTFAKALAWVSILLILASLIAIGGYCFTVSNTYPDENDAKVYLKWVGVGVWITAALYVVALLCLWKSLHISLAVLEAASEFVGTNISIVIVPMVFFALNVIVFAFWILAIISVISVGDIDNGPEGTQYKVVKWNEQTRNTVYFMLFGILWITSFMIACCQFIIIVATANWYFSHGSDTKGNINIYWGAWWIVRYHLGSIAFGSFIVAVVWSIRIIFEFISSRIKSTGGQNSSIIRCVLCACRCCLDCVDRFVKYINRNAYIQIALTSENFCPSAMNAFMLILKHSEKFTLLSGIGNIFIVLGKMTIASIVTLIGFIMVENWGEIQEALDSPATPLAVIFLISYVVGAVFVSVFSTSSNTILQCFLVDTDISQQQGRADAHHRPSSLEGFIHITKKDEIKTNIMF